jgi:hypothetical protein
MSRKPKAEEIEFSPEDEATADRAFRRQSESGDWGEDIVFIGPDGEPL